MRTTQTGKNLTNEGSIRTGNSGSNMSFKDKKSKVCEAAIEKRRQEEIRQNEKEEERVHRNLRTWTRITIWIGIALGICVMSVVPFSKGHFLHKNAEPWGRILVYLSMCLVWVFLFSVVAFYSSWKVFRSEMEFQRRFAPPGSKYRIGKK